MKRLPVSTSRRFLVLAALAFLATACGSRSTLDETGTGLPPGAIWPEDHDDDAGPGDDEAPSDPDASTSPDGSSSNESPNAPPSVTEGFGPVCLDFLDKFNGASDRQACLACINKAQIGPCRAEHEAAIKWDESCGQPNDCASVMCQCNKTCPATLCSCIERCMRFAPDTCLDRWTNLWSCIRHACDEDCS